jgi:glutamyl/glutaminyl-tRNA synthetase
VFDREKLKWINKEHLKQRPQKENYDAIKNEIQKSKRFNEKKWKGSEVLLDPLCPIIFERITRFGEVGTLIDAGELDFFFEKPTYETVLLYWKGEKDPTLAPRHLEQVNKLLSGIEEKSWSSEAVKNAIWDYASKEGKGNVLWPLRVALSGMEKSPDPFSIAGILGKKETLSRVAEAQERLT